jgi:hypothetical protein
MDTQIVELIGRHHLTAELLRAGLEVATPVRDRGIDLIAYADIDERLHTFASCPIQMKAAMKRSFGLATKYKRVHNLLIAYVWHLEDLYRRVTYALTYQEAFSIAEELGWTRTKSWKRGAYITTRPSAEILSLLEQYRMTPQKWREKVAGLLMEYGEQEAQKAEGWRLYQSGSTSADRARGLFMVIEAHFYRNPEAPGIPTYASHWLWANQRRYDREVVDLLIAKYPLPNAPRIQPGFSDWDSYGNPNYKVTACEVTGANGR